jgi:hypothetical protein
VLSAGTSAAPPWEPRNHKRRWSSYISTRQALNVIEAAGFAERVGLRPNRFITIHFDQGELLIRPQESLGVFFKLSREWLEVRGVPGVYLWALEDGWGLGLHAHILMHVPAEHAASFATRQSGWLGKSGLAAKKARVVQTQHVRSFKALRGAIKYMLKGASPEFLTIMQGQISGSPSSTIYGKRCGTSEAIGRTARIRAEINKRGELPNDLGKSQRGAV